MAELKKIIMDKKRMCKYFYSKQNGCGHDCPMRKGNFDCTKLILERAQDEEIIIEDWADKNPAMTNEMMFKKVFGNKCLINADYDVRHKCNGICDKCQYFADAEYHAPEGSEK